MTVNASDPAAAVTNVIAQGGAPAPNTPITLAGGSSTSSTSSSGSGATSGAPTLNRDLTLAFVVLVVAGIAIAVSSWQAGATFVQWGLVIAIVILLVKDSTQFTNFLNFLGSGGSSG